MKAVRDYERVRRMYFREKRKKREISRITGISRKLINKMLAHPAPPGYRRRAPIRRPKLGPYIPKIDEILETDKGVRKKQRHTARRIFDRLREEYGFDGGYTIVKDYVREKKKRMKAVFVPLRHDPGEAQIDFGKSVARIAGKMRDIKVFCLNLPYSGLGFVMAFPTERGEAFVEGHNQAFQFIGGVPRICIYDNTKVAVKKILKGPDRDLTETFLQLKSHYLFEHRFCNPASGHEKGNVEGEVGFSRRNYLVPIPDVADFDELNAELLKRCEQRKKDSIRGRIGTIGERFEEEKSHLLPLPPYPMEACDRSASRVSSLLLVRFDRNDYSAPSEYAHHGVEIKGFVNHVEICHKDKIIAVHLRSYSKETCVFDPIHYLAVLERKPGALDQARPLDGWDLPACFEDLRRILEARSGHRGVREYIQVLRLLEDFPLKDLRKAVIRVLGLSIPTADAVKITLLSMRERAFDPVPLNPENCKGIPFPRVISSNVRQYGHLLAARREVVHG
jgi:transposase